jgi:hypothetical protein
MGDSLAKRQSAKTKSPFSAIHLLLGLEKYNYAARKYLVRPGVACSVGFARLF